MLLTRIFSERRAPLKENPPIYCSLSASPGIVYIRMISKDQYAYGKWARARTIEMKHI